MKKWMKNKYRICTDYYLGYEVQIKRWWFPIWTCVAFNTHSTVEQAEKYAELHASSGVKVKSL